MNTRRVAVLIGALCLVSLGLLGAAWGLLGAWLSPDSEKLAAATLGFSFLGLGAGLGSLLAWQAWQAIEGKPSRPFRPGHIWLFVLVFGLAVAAGQAVLTLDLLPILAFPPLHLAAGAIPPFAILALAGRRLGADSRWREIVLQISSGAFLSTSLAFLLEFGVLMTIAIVGVSLAALRPEGLDWIQAFASRFQDPAWLKDPAQQSALLTALVKSPAVVALVFLTVSGLVPIIEETVKTIGVGLLAWRHPSRAQAVLWGLAGGAGFALAEALLSSAGVLEAWAPAVLVRAAATLFHSFTGALVGWAWYLALTQKSWLRALGLYGASVCLHGLWNGLAVGTALLGLTDNGTQLTTQGAAGVAVALLGLLALGCALGLTFLVRYASDHSAAGNAS